MQPAKPQISLSIRESLERTLTVKLLTEQHLELSKLNPFKPNGVSHCYQLEQSIFVSIDVGWYFSFYSNFNRTFCKQTVKTLKPRSVASGLDLHCMPTSHKKDTRLLWFKRKLCRLVWVYTCQIATLLDITCHWSISRIGMNIIRLHDNQSEMFIVWNF